MAQHEKFDINEASMEELTRIPGISDFTAQAIIEFRESHGQITDIEELTEARQLTEQDIDSLREWLTVGSGSAGRSQFWGEEVEEVGEGEEEELD